MDRAAERHHRLEPRGLGQSGHGAKIRRLLAKYDYPPDLEDAAVELVLQQAQQYALAA
ncbi:type I restriction enzyme endonuclease domain-containing protein [Blastococcus brunescens]|uniref:type I restriction enzyme endonuclease domain-containing protein n=1 Tax=Blastococcus brunescens TaxID=1564165 RepID=UPI003BEEDFF7